MKMFRKEKNSGASTSVERKVTELEMIVKRSLAKLALYLQSKTDMLSGAMLKIMLLVFCLTWSGISIYFTLSAFISFDKNKSLIIIEKIHPPKYYQNTGEEKLRAETFSGDRSYSKVQSFKGYMDSLNSTDKGRLVHDSILLARPHLLDSIRLLSVLQSQQK